MKLLFTFPNNNDLFNGSYPVGTEEYRDKTEKSYYHCVSHKYPVSSYTLPEIYANGAKNYPDRGIIWYRPEERLTYKQLYDKTLLFAKGLLGLGVTRGDTVICFGSQGSDCAIMFFACSTIGVIFQAPYLYSPVDKIVYDCIEKVNPKVILIGNASSGMKLDNTFEVVEQVLVNRIAKNEAIHIFYDDQVATDPNCRTDDENGIMSRSLAALLEAGASVTDKRLNEARGALSLNEPCVYTTTSGSTGDPKLTVIGAATYSNSGIRQKERYGAKENMVFGAPNMCTEDIATIDQLLAGFAIGMDTVIFPHQTTWNTKMICQEILDVCQKYKPHMIYVDNYYLSCIINNPEYREGYDISATKSFLLTGSTSSAVFKQSLVEVVPDSMDCYGLSEFFYVSCSYPGELKKKPTTIGKPYPNVEIMIVDENGNCVPRMTHGEILVRGCGIFICYKNEPEKTRSALTDEGWYKTGDCGYMDSDGDLYIVGRMSERERFKVFGDVIYAAPIENKMKNLSKIKECAVLGRQCEGNIGHELIYCIVPYEKVALSKQEVLLFAMTNTNQQEWPARVFFYDELPHNTLRAKVSKKILLERVEKEVGGDNTAGWVDYLEWEKQQLLNSK